MIVDADFEPNAMTTDPLSPLRKITESLRQVQQADQVSSELKVYAEELNESLMPTVKLFKQSAIKIQQSLPVSFDKINLARETWKSKQRIDEINPLEIWEEIGKISGLIQKIKLAKSQSRIISVETITKEWNDRSSEIKNKYFNNQQVTDKILSTIKIPQAQEEINEILDNISKEMNYIVIRQLEYICELSHQKIDHDKIEGYFFIEDPTSKEKFEMSLNLVDRELQASSENSSELIKLYVTKFKKSAIAIFEPMKFIGFQNNEKIEAYNSFERKVKQLISQTIESIFDERVELTTVILEDILLFYDYLLEQQQRYSQESSEMRKNEQDWIDTQEAKLRETSNQLEKKFLRNLNFGRFEKTFDRARGKGK
jgi:hypothetical protein